MKRGLIVEVRVMCRALQFDLSERYFGLWAIRAWLKNLKSQFKHRYGQYRNIGQKTASSTPARWQRSISCSPQRGQARTTFANAM